jgi:hypothetical protein
MPGHRVQLIPQRLGIDEETVASHHPHLALQREVVGVLRDGDADSKLRCVAPTGDHLRGARRGHHRPIACAPILLAHVMLDLIGELDRRDPIRRLRLPGHRSQLAAARGALPLLRPEFVTNLDDR